MDVGNLIDEYIEKDIVRQVKIIEYLFELKQIDTQKLADLLKVNRMTIKRDIEKILLLDSRIQLNKEKLGYVTVYFLSELTRYELVQKLYNQSYFLRICTLYLLGETNYLKISEKEHISVAKVFSVKKKVEEFFSKVGIMTKEGGEVKDEFRYRLIILTIWMRGDFFEQIIDRRIFIDAQKIVEQFLGIFSTELNLREKRFLILNVYLSLKRNNKELDLPKKANYLFQKTVYTNLENLLIPYQLNKKEIRYLTTMYCLLNHNLANYHHLEMDNRNLRKKYMNKVPQITELVNQFELKFHCELIKNIIFERSLFRFLVAIFFNRPMLLVERSSFIGEHQLNLSRKVKNLVSEWGQKNNYTIYLDQKAVEKFCLQVYDVLIKKNTSKIYNVFIVAENEVSHIMYREWINLRLNTITEKIVVDQSLYYSLDQLPIYISRENSIIICERVLTEFPFDEYQGIKLFPVSLFSINQDYQKFFEYFE